MCFLSTKSLTIFQFYRICNTNNSSKKSSVAKSPVTSYDMLEQIPQDSVSVERKPEAEVQAISAEFFAFAQKPDHRRISKKRRRFLPETESFFEPIESGAMWKRGRFVNIRDRNVISVNQKCYLWRVHWLIGLSKSSTNRRLGSRNGLATAE